MMWEPRFAFVKQAEILKYLRFSASKVYIRFHVALPFSENSVASKWEV